MSTSQYQSHAPAGLTASEPFVSAHGRAVVLVVLFVAYIVVAICTIGTNLMQLTMSPIALGGEGASGQVVLTDLLQLLVGLGTLAVFVALVVTFLMWLHRVAKNVPALGNPKSRVEYTPGWAVGSFFIPFGNLYMPYKAVREVWERSDPAVRTEDDFMFAPPSSAPVLLGWWITWVASNVLSRVSWRLQSDTASADTLRAIAGIDIASDVLAIASAALAIVVVKDIDRRQQERARHVSHVPHTPPPPPLFRPPSLPSNAGGQPTSTFGNQR